MKSAAGATLFLGPKGGFRHLRIERGSGKNALTIYDSVKAGEYKKILHEAGISVREERA